MVAGWFRWQLSVFNFAIVTSPVISTRNRIPERDYWLAVTFSLVVAALAISNQSLWIDEGMTAMNAIQPTLQTWWQHLYHEHNSNLQLPLYMSYIWGWEKIFGSSEAAFRAGNIPWFLVAMLAIAWGARGRRWRGTLLLVAAFHPLVWYYLNEARPYMVFYAGASILMACLMRALSFSREELQLDQQWWWMLSAGVVVTCCASMLGVLWASCIVAAIIVLRPHAVRNTLWAVGKEAVVVMMSVLVALGAYYAWTLYEGASAAHIRSSFSKGIVFVAYEQLGFGGLGPGRNLIREREVNAFNSYAVPLAIYGVLLSYVLFHGWRFLAQRLSRREILVVGAAICLPIALTFVAGAMSPFRVLGRHVMPLAVFVSLIQALGIYSIWMKRNVLQRVIAASVVACLLVSDLEYRYSVRHAKDDYRSAAYVAKAALNEGKSVWWAADGSTGRYYKLPLTLDSREREKMLRPELVPPNDLMAAAPPNVIVLSRRDLFDSSGAIDRIIRQDQFHCTRSFQDFTVWER